MKASLTDAMSNNKVQIDACSFARSTSVFQNRLHEEGRECRSGQNGILWTGGLSDGLVLGAEDEVAGDLQEVDCVLDMPMPEQWMKSSVISDQLDEARMSLTVVMCIGKVQPYFQRCLMPAFQGQLLRGDRSMFIHSDEVISWNVQ